MCVPGQELLDLGQDPLAVADDEQVVVPGQFHVSRVGHVRGEPARVAHVDRRVVATVQQQRGRLDRRQHLAHVRLARDVEQQPQRAGLADSRSSFPNQRRSATSPARLGAIRATRSPSPQWAKISAMRASRSAGVPGHS